MRYTVVALSVISIFQATFAQSPYWQQTRLSAGLDVRSLAISNTDKIFAASEDSAIYRSTNGGGDWAQMSLGITYPSVYTLAAFPNGEILAGGLGVFRSTNEGQMWLPTGTLNAGVFSLAYTPSGTMFAGTGGGVYRSTDGSKTWAHASSGMSHPSSADVWSFVVNRSGVAFASANLDGVFRSTDNGDSWVAVDSGLTNADVRALALDAAGNLFAGTTSGGAFRSADNGDSWWTVGLTTSNVTSVVVNTHGHIFAGTYGDGVFFSNDGGAIWSQINGGLTNVLIRALAIDSTGFIYAATDMGGVFKSILPTTYANTSRVGLALSFALSQNYPNPFNPSTTIKFELPKSSQVVLTVFDILGRQVSVLVDDRRGAGVHVVKFDGSNLASGVYFYRIQAGDYVASKKMLILK